MTDLSRELMIMFCKHDMSRNELWSIFDCGELADQRLCTSVQIDHLLVVVWFVSCHFCFDKQNRENYGNSLSDR